MKSRSGLATDFDSYRLDQQLLFGIERQRFSRFKIRIRSFA